MDYRRFTFTDDRFTITHTRTTYEKNGKSWRRTAAEEPQEVSPKYYENFVTSIPFFNSLGRCRAEFNYTAAGYIPIKITSINPDGTKKHIDEFYFAYNNPQTRETLEAGKMWGLGGFRERYAMQNGTREIEYINGEKCYIYRYSKEEEYQDANGATYNTVRGAWVG